MTRLVDVKWRCPSRGCRVCCSPGSWLLLSPLSWLLHHHECPSRVLQNPASVPKAPGREPGGAAVAGAGYHALSSTAGQMC